MLTETDRYYLCEGCVRYILEVSSDWSLNNELTQELIDELANLFKLNEKDKERLRNVTIDR
jgi:predicted Fe-S protein YdhL (DUF1289 family)